MAEGILNPIPQLEADFDFDIYTKQEVDALLDEKADKIDTYTKTEVDTLLGEKADADSVYTKTETDTLLSAKADADSVYNKTEVDNALALKANSADVYTKSQADTLLSAKADKATTLAGYGITDAYTKTETDASLALKAPLASPALSGVPTAPTASAGTNTTQIATTQFVTSAVKVPADRLEKLISILEGQIYDYETVADVSYTKSVPTGAVEHANLDMIGGKTLVWNQLNDNSSSTSTVNDVTFTKNNDGTWTVNGTASAQAEKSVATLKTDAAHKYLLRGCPAGGSGYSIYLSGFGTYDTGNGVIRYPSVGRDSAYLVIRVDNGVNVDNLVFKPQVFDLTLMFGAGNEPTTVSQFQEMFPADYYSFDSGTLLSAGVTDVVSKDADNTTIDTLSIPADIQALEGYGWSTNGYVNEVDFEHKKSIQRVGKVVFDGSADEGWNYNSTYNYFETSLISGAVNANTNSNNVISDKYVWGNISNNNSETGFTLIWAKVRVRMATMPTLEDFKTDLSNNPMTVYYQLATPVETDISSYLTDDTIAVESGGTLTMVNSHGDDYRIPIPNQETFLIDLEYALDH